MPAIHHIGIDVREACNPHRTGKGQWTYGFVTELLERDIGITVFADAPMPDSWQKHFSSPSVHRKLIAIEQKGIRWHWSVARYVKADATIGAYVSPVSYIVPSLLGRSVPTIPVVHDLIAFRREPHDLKAMAIERLMLGKTVRSTDHICTISTATKMDILSRYPSLAPSKVTPIFAGRAFDDSAGNAPDGRTILCIGTLCPRKNQKRLIQAFASLPLSLRAHAQLVLVGGRGWKDADIIALANAIEGVEWMTYLSDDDCRALLKSATVFAFPSLYEGFGMPVLDAMARGIPVLTSDRGSLREVAGDGALYCDPESVESIASGLERLLIDQDLRRDLSLKGKDQAAQFTWPRTVDLFLEALEKVIPPPSGRGEGEGVEERAIC